MLMKYYWKGNIRELENAIERAVILCDGEVITPDHFIPGRQYGYQSSEKSSITEGSLEAVAKEATRTVETQRIMNVLKDTRGNKSRAAEILQVSYKTLLTKIKEYGIES
jgi:DNA-binding NtrC family response regulator